MRDIDYTPLVFDVETAPLPNAAEYLEPVQPARNLKDPEKIAEDIRQRTLEQAARCSLDWNVGRIVAIGYWPGASGDVVALECPEERNEVVALELFWEVAKHRPLVGFNIRAFDLPFLIQRSRYLGVTHRDLDLGRYAKSPIVDLYELLTFGQGKYDQGAMKRTLKAFAKRFGLSVNDTTDGADIPALVEKGDWDAIAAHCESDVRLTRDLAARLGVLSVGEAMHA